MTDVSIPTDQKSKLHLVCLFLAQPGEPHVDLGYDTINAAFEDIALIFDVPKNTVKNERDSFDRFTNSGRVGWEASVLRPGLQVVFDTYSAVERETLLEFSKEILTVKNAEIENTLEIMKKVQDSYLVDLKELYELSGTRTSKILADQICAPSLEAWEEFLSLYLEEMPGDKAVVVNAAMTITTPKHAVLTISAQEFPRCWAVRPYVLGILNYEKKVDELANELGFASRGSGRAKEIFIKLPSENWETELLINDVTNIKNVVEHKLGLDAKEQKNFLKFLTYRKRWGLNKTLERSDWPPSAIGIAGAWLANASDRRGELSIALAKSEAFNALMQTYNLEKPSVSTVKGGENVIFYGAPGTGKSYKVDRIVTNSVFFRTVFHPDLQNSDFFGCLKPQMNDGAVHYGFSPGPFMLALAEAHKNAQEPVYLVIEELNRASAAAVFGDLFLLLDRDDEGKGVYDTVFPSPESQAWFVNETGAYHSELRLPSNLFIYSTMNSADQGVYPIDTAFRRRWRQEYLPLDYKKGPDGDVAYVDSMDTHHSLEWRRFVKLLNEHLISNSMLEIGEDRLLGQWFVKKEELDGKGIPEKVLLYLWDDLLRNEGRDLIFNTGKIKTYGNLVIAIERGSSFLSDQFLQVLDVDPLFDEVVEQEESGEDAG